MTETRKVLLLKPDYEFFPMGLSYVASTMERAGVEYDYVDCYYDDVDLEERFKGDDYFALATGGLVGDFPFFAKIFDQAKQLRPDLPCIIGGNIARDVNPEVLFGHTKVDYAVLGEAEIIFPELLAKLITGERDISGVNGLIYRSIFGKITKTPRQKRFDITANSAFPSLKFLDDYAWMREWRRTVPILTGRGCTGKCSFCAPSHRSFRARPLEDVMHEIRMIIDRFDPELLQFLNEVFYDDEESVIEFCTEYKKHFDKPFLCVLRLDMDPRVLSHLKAANCVGFNVGVESGSNAVLEKMCKQITTDMTRAFIAEAKRLGGMKILSGFMFGSEGETEEDIQQTIDLHDELKIQSGVSPVVPYPGTPIYRRALHRGLIEDEYQFLLRVCGMWFRDFPSDSFFLKDGKGKSVLPNLTAIPDDRFVKVMLRTYLRLHSYYGLKSARLESEGEQLFIHGNCPCCGVEASFEFDRTLPMIKNISCPNVRKGDCINSFEFHAHIYSIKEVADHARQVAEQMKGKKRIALVGSKPLPMKFLLDHDVFKIDFEDVIGVAYPYSRTCSGYLYQDRFSACNAPNTKYYPLEELLKMEPDAVILAEMAPQVELDYIRDVLVKAGVDESILFDMCPRDAIPYPEGANFWRTVEKLPELKKTVVWPAGGFGRSILEESVLDASKVVAFVDKNPGSDAETFHGKRIVEPSAVSEFDFDSILIATGVHEAEIMESIKSDPTLAEKQLVWVTEYFFREMQSGPTA
jgi:radical SAM superfamily enzyme YgiQ (UPF0313 family)